jgi:hypothetical protein
MDISEEIDKICDIVSKLNKQLDIDRKSVKKVIKVSNETPYHEKKQMYLHDSIDMGKRQKLINGEITQDEFDNKHNMTEEEFETVSTEKEKAEYYKNWSRVAKIHKQNTIKIYVNSIDALSHEEKEKLIKELFKLLKDDKLNSQYVKYNKDEGKIDTIKKLKINEKNHTYKLDM